MKLLTKEIIKKLEVSSENVSSNSESGFSDDAQVIVKFFNPTGSGTWWVMDGEEVGEGDWEFFGVVSLLETEWGYFTLSQLESIELPFGLGIERDMHYKGTYADLKEYKSANR